MEKQLKQLAGKRLCLDPGHPSEVGEGTTGKKISEIQVAWQVCLRLEALLKANGAQVKRTKRTEKERVTNKQRALIANSFASDFVVRLHCDADSWHGHGGVLSDPAGHG